MTLRLTRTEWDPADVEQRVDELSREAPERAGQVLLEAANGRVPYRTGELASSGRVEQHDDGAAVTYEAPHAPILRAHPEWEYAGGRSGRWLEEAMDASAGEVGRAMEETVRSGWPGG